MDREAIITAILDNLNGTKRLMHTRMRAVLGSAPISQTQLEVLLHIYHRQPVNAKDLAQALHLSRGAVSQLVDALQQQQLVERKNDVHDRRIQHLRLAAAGSKLLTELDQQRHQVIRAVMQDLNDEDLQTWLRIQQKMMQALEQQTKTNTKGDTL